MNNPLFGGMPSFGGDINPMQLLSQLRSNPMAILKQAGFNVPSNLSNPQEIIQHLMNSGQVSQQQLNNAQMMAQTFNFR